MDGDYSMRESFNSFDGDFDLVLDKAFAQPTTPPDAIDSPVRRASDIFQTPNRLDSSEDSMGPLTPVDREYDSLGQLWETLRQKKAKQMAKDPIKVKSLGVTHRELHAPQPISSTRHRSPRPSSPSTISQESPSNNRRRYPEQPIPQMGMPGMSTWRERPTSPSPSSPSEVPKPEPKMVKKRKSMYAFLASQSITWISLISLLLCSVTFRESHEGRTMTATFDLPGIKKNQVHISFRGKYLIIDWTTMTVTEYEENGKIVRDRKEKECSRTLPMPEGTRVRSPYPIPLRNIACSS